jgi:tripartite ATP-independent transporter DctM subunit
MVTIALVLVLVLLAAFAAGMYVSMTLGWTALVVGWLFSERPFMDILSNVPWNVMTNATLVALPLFILMGEILLRSGVTEGMYDTLSQWTNRLPGGLLHTNIAASAMFACVSGSSAATAATVGGVAIPFLRARGYSEKLMLGSIAAGGTLGILIPPSIVMIVYGVLAEESIGRLYMAGIVPGLLLTFGFMGVILLLVRSDASAAPAAVSATWRERLIGLLRLLPIGALILLVLGTIYAGIATATEAAAFGVVGALAITALNRRLSRAMLRDTFLATANTTAMIMLILICAFFLQFVVSFLGIPNALSSWVVGLKLSKFELVLAICLIYIILGMFMESLSMVVITLPILLPMLKTMGVDLIWFGIIVVILVEMALITPPVGMNLFILQSIAEGPSMDKRRIIAALYAGIVPFLGAMIVLLVLLFIFPDLALWLPRTARGS